MGVKRWKHDGPSCSSQGFGRTVDGHYADVRGPDPERCKIAGSREAGAEQERLDAEIDWRIRARERRPSDQEIERLNIERRRREKTGPHPRHV